AWSRFYQQGARNQMRKLLSSLVLLGCAPLTWAATITLNATDSGWYDNSGNHPSNNQNYTTGYRAGSSTFRSFFIFNLAGVSGITSATLSLYVPCSTCGDHFDGYQSPNPSET